METKKIITIGLKPSLGKVLIKAEKNDKGNYEKNGERYLIHSSELVFAPESDAKNWQEADNLDVFLDENEFLKIIDLQETE